jgi:hypothetical protein
MAHVCVAELADTECPCENSRSSTLRPVTAKVEQVCTTCNGLRYMVVLTSVMPKEDNARFPLEGKRCADCRGTGKMSVEKTLYEEC